MSEEVRFSVVGGYGLTGKAVVSELLQSGRGEILVGGRDVEKGKALAAEFAPACPHRTWMCWMPNPWTIFAADVRSSSTAADPIASCRTGWPKRRFASDATTWMSQGCRA